MVCSLTSALALTLALHLLAGYAQAATARGLLQKPSDTLTGSAIVMAINYPGKDARPMRLLAVRTEDGNFEVELDDPTELQGLTMDMEVTISGEWEAGKTPGGRRRFKGASIRDKKGKPDWAGPKDKDRTQAASASAASKKGKLQAATTTGFSSNPVVVPTLNTIVIPLGGFTDSGALCPGLGPSPLSINAIKATVFAESNPTGHTVGSTFGDCSYNKTMLTNTTSRVANYARLPCNGTTNGVNWNFNSCSFENFNGWADAADALMPSRGFSMNQYRYRAYLVPPGVCDFAGIGYVGCTGAPGGECRVYIGSDFWGTPAAYVHELGHNLFMDHAASVDATGVIDYYGDDTCAMGYCCSNRCYNTPHAWQLGWISMQPIDATNLAPGQTVVTSLASQGTTSRSGVRITPTWANATDPIYLGYRTPVNGDVDLDMGGTPGRVHIYTSPVTGSYTPALSTLRATLAVANSSWTHPTAGFVVRLRGFPIIGGVPRTVATVTVCRANGPETAATCAAGTDNDCNGLAGTKDPACAALTVRK